MNRNQWVNRTADSTGLTQADVRRVLDTALSMLGETVAAGEKVQLQGFGTFEPVDRPERESRTPVTGTTVITPAKRVVKFKPHTAFKDVVNGLAPTGQAA